MPRGGSSLWLRALGAEDRDRQVLGWSGLAFALLQAGSTLSVLALTGRFLGRVGVASIPLVYVILNVLTLGLFLAIGIRGRRAGSGRSLGLWIPGASLGLLVLALAPGAKQEFAILIAYVLAWLYSIVVEMEFWAWLSSRVSVRLGRRLTAGISGAGTLGRLAGASLAMDPMGWRSIGRLLILAAILNALVLPCLARTRMAARRHEEGSDAMPATGGPAPVAPSQVLAEIRSNPMLVRFAVVSFATGVLSGAADYPLAAMAPERYPIEEQLAAFFGTFGVVASLVSVVLQLLLTGWLSGRLTVGASLAIYPLAMAGLGLAGWLHPGFHVAALVRFTQRVAVRVVHSPASLILLNAVPPSLGLGVRSLVASASMSLGFVVSGLAMLAVTPPPLPWVYLGMLAAGLTAAAATVGIDRGYLRTLMASTRSASDQDRRRDLARDARAYLGGSGVGEALLASGREGLTSALEAALIEAQGRPLAPFLVEELVRRGPRTAGKALQILVTAHLPGPVASGLVERWLESGHERLVARAARAAGALGDPGLAPALEACLAPGRGFGPRARIPVAGALLRVATDPECLGRASRILARSGLDPDPSVRRASIEVLGSLGLRSLYRPLVAALSDPDHEVRREAALALGRARLAEGLAGLERAQATEPDARVREEMENARSRIQDARLGEVAGLLESLPERERKRLVRRIGSLRAGDHLRLLAAALRERRPGARAALVACLRDTSDRGLRDALERSLTGNGDEASLRGPEARDPTEPGEGREEPGTLGIDPLLRFLSVRGPGLGGEHPVLELLDRIHEPSHREPLLRFLETWLPRRPAEIGAAELASRTEIACQVVGILTRDREGYRRAYRTAVAGTGRESGAALELVDVSLSDPSLRARLVRCLEALRQRPPAVQEHDQGMGGKAAKGTRTARGK